MIDTPEHFDDEAAIAAYNAHLDQLLEDHSGKTRWEQFDLLMHEVRDGPYPYWASTATAAVVNAVDESRAAERLYLIWRALEDGYEIQQTPAGKLIPAPPEQMLEAVRDMRQAATEWLTLTGEPESRTEYLDHWEYDVCGYERTRTISSRLRSLASVRRAR